MLLEKENAPRAFLPNVTWRTSIFLSVIAAAAKYYNDSKNHDPCAVVVKDVAQAVVIHYVSLRELLSDFLIA